MLPYPPRSTNTKLIIIHSSPSLQTLVYRNSETSNFYNSGSLASAIMFDQESKLPSSHFQRFNPTFSYENYRSSLSGGGIQFTARGMGGGEDESSGVCSPPLWKNTNYRQLSPNSRAQAIARGQWELMEMVKNMPESSYELSLKDLVEQPPRMEAKEERLVGEKIGFGRKSESQEGKRIKRKAKMVRSGSVENGGLLLKMVFPLSLGYSKKRNSSAASTACSRVSPKPEPAEWWKRRLSGLSESGSSGGSSRSSSLSGSTRKSNGYWAGCWSFIPRRNKRNEK
ncbi:uncharacterized protein LOC127807124 [Diospyros lotus]|uniref:uncharacterized protein LOC127807124 n=1 Tax=Diospyros lotus TaxID=55363 RepID=UPI002252C675|nr:uncharacterized protein LOC127807124 [Diospyros lotus]